MIENNDKLSIVIDNEEYSNSTQYLYEKKYDWARYFIEYHRIVDEFKKDYNIYANLATSYEKSLLCHVKTIIEAQNYSHSEKDRIAKNSMEIEVLVTKNGKERQIKELKISDKLVEYFGNKMELSYYDTYLTKYKKLRDEGKQQFFIFESGKEYSTKEEFRNIKMLLETTRNALELLNSKPVSKEEENKVFEWKDFLTKSIKIESREIEYGIVLTEIESLPEFNRQELDTIHNLNEYFEKALSVCKPNTVNKEPEIVKE